MKSFLVAALVALALIDGTALTTANALKVRQRESVPSRVTANPIANTTYGAVRGVVQLDTIMAFRAIPFAEPPVGDLRFAPTAPLKKGWNGVLDGTKPSAGCMSFCPNTSFPRPAFMCPTTVSEDCLYLNIYTPTLDPKAYLPVVVYYHGGNYQFGAAGVPLYDGSDLAKNENVVVVTTNYRLNVFGALWNGDTIRGNFQTQDQRQALKFVREIIGSFGGDKDDVTISGQSAGGFSVTTHLVSPKSWDYFHKAIIVSNPFSLPALPLPTAMKLMEKVAEFVGCPLTPGPAQVTCFRNAPAQKLLEASNQRYVNISNAVTAMMQWTPVVDGDEVPLEPFKAMTTGQFHHVPIFMGVTSNESVQFIYDLSEEPMTPIMYIAMMDIVFGLERGTKAMQYYGDIPAHFQTDARQFLSVPATDFIFYCSNRAVARSATISTPVYFWVFDYLASWNEWVFGPTMSFCVKNVCHAEDLPFIFNPFAVPVPGEETPVPTPGDLALIRSVQKAWGNFIWTNSPEEVDGVTVGRYNAGEANMLNLSVPVSVIRNWRAKYCDFWESTGRYIV